MKTKVAILEQDENYIRRLMNSFQTMYADKLELNIFSSLNQLYEGLKEENFDVILADEKIDVDRERIPRGIGLAYLCESVSVEEIRGIPAVCKYQRADLIYKQILGLRWKTENLKRKELYQRLFFFFRRRGVQAHLQQQQLLLYVKVKTEGKYFI